MVESKTEFFCITDNDVFPPKISPDWLSSMISIMKNHPELAILAPQLPPQWLQQPYEAFSDVVYAKAVGNTFKLCRTDVMRSLVCKIDQKIGEYGDDGLISSLVMEAGYKVAFCRNIFCYHAGQCENWGYEKEQVALDPRKIGYGRPYIYEIENMETYEPVKKYRI